MESFNGKLRDELLNLDAFDTLLEVQVLTGQCRRTYNRIRHHKTRCNEGQRRDGRRPPLVYRQKGRPSLEKSLCGTRLSPSGRHPVRSVFARYSLSRLERFPSPRDRGRKAGCGSYSSSSMERLPSSGES